MTRDLKVQIIFEDSESPNPPTQMGIKHSITNTNLTKADSKRVIMMCFDNMIKRLRKELKEELNK